MELTLTLLALAFVCQSSQGASVDDWRSRSIYQVVTDRFALTNGSIIAACDPADGVYCGGTYRGIIRNLGYVQDMGFSAIWISPITLQLEEESKDLGSYHGYWQQNLYALNEHFGTVADLEELSTALHLRGMYLMVDVVVNHFGWVGNGTTVNYSALYPFDDPKYFHPYCEVDSTSNMTNSQDCWLGDTIVSLPDLRTEDSVVMSMYASWVKELVSNYSIDGLRIDTVFNVKPTFFPNWTNSAGVFCIGEVDDGDAQTVCPYQDYIDGVLNYPIYFPLVRAFIAPSGSIKDLVDEMSSVRFSCKDPTILGSFLENHDQPRFGSYTDDLSLAKNAIAYTMLSDGIPIIYQGQEQHYVGGQQPLNREAIWPSGYNTSSPLYKHITSLNLIRSHATAKDVNFARYLTNPIYTDANTIAMRKGYNGSQVITILSNLGSAGEAYNLSLPDTGFSTDEGIIELLQCKTFYANATSGSIIIPMESGLPRVLYPSSLLDGSGLCGAPLSASPTVTVKATGAATAIPTASHTKKSSANMTSISVVGVVILLALSIILSELR